MHSDGQNQIANIPGFTPPPLRAAIRRFRRPCSKSLAPVGDYAKFRKEARKGAQKEKATLST